MLAAETVQWVDVDKLSGTKMAQLEPVSGETNVRVTSGDAYTETLICMLMLKFGLGIYPRERR